MLLFLLDQIEDTVEGGYVDQEQAYHADGVKNGVAAEEVVENIVGSAVALLQEHVVGAQGRVREIRGDTEDSENGVGDGDIAPLHAGLTRQDDVEGGEARDAVGQPRGYVIQREDGVGVIVLSRPNRAEDGAQETEDEDKVQSGFSDPSLGKGRQGNGDELDAAQKQGEVVLPGGGIVAAVAHDGDLGDLDGVHKDGGGDQDPVFGAGIPSAVAESQPDGQSEHGKEQGSRKQDMLPGQVALGLAGIAADAKKFFHDFSFRVRP